MSIRYHDWISHHAARRGSDLAAVDVASDRRFSYKEFDDRIARLATALREYYGVGFGDRVAVLAMNCTDTFELLYACGRLGAILVPCNWRLALAELEVILADCTPTVLFFGSEFASNARLLAEAFPKMEICKFDAADSGYESLIAGAVPQSEAADISLDDPVVILYTSGTTGRPKGVIITHGMAAWNSVNGAVGCQINRESVCLTFLPLFHTGGLNMLANPTFHAGGTVVVVRSFDAGETLKLIGDSWLKVSHVVGVTSHFQFMGEHPSFAYTDFSRLVLCGIGGSTTPDIIYKNWAERGVILQQIYGMTESGPMVSMLEKREALSRASSAGKPMLYTEVKLVGADGQPVPIGATGELWIRGPHVTPGYWNRPDETAKAITDGWFHSGDAVTMDDEGYIYIVDRWKDMYISGGENIYPAEIENVLYEHSSVKEAAVIAVKDDRWGEVGRAIVVLKLGSNISEDVIIRHCAEKLARYKLPKSVVFIDELPRNGAGKVHKPTLRELYGSL